MKKYSASVFFLFMLLTTAARDKDSTIHYNLPDSVRGIQFLAEINVSGLKVRKRMTTGISVQGVQVYLYEHKGRRGIGVQMHELSRVLSLGHGVTNRKYGGINFPYNWKEDKTYKLMIATASDSASGITVFSAYIFLPAENKWKFLVSRLNPFYRQGLQELSSFTRSDKRSAGNIVTGQVWVQRSSGSWKYLKDSTASPVVNLFGHIDSVAQRQTDIKMITDSIAAGKTDVQQQERSVYYKMMKEGTGRQIQVTDTVVAYYKGYLFANGIIFDETKDKPATFPLKRLILGWQIGVPLCKVGGKIKLVIPSDLAYSIRTRAAKIPPNSILVFEIEVVDVKPAPGSQ